MSQSSYDQHTVYLTPLLHKHESDQGITFEHLQSAWNRLQKYCQPSHPLDEMKSLHKSLLEKYNSAARSYYTSLLGQYHPPSLLPSKDDESLLTLFAYTSKAMQQLPIQEWKVDSNSITQWFHQPLKDILAKHYKKEELSRKLQGLKDQHLQKHALQQQGVNDTQQPPTSNELKDATANIGQEKLPQEETKKSTKQEIAIADSKEHDANVVADDEDVISSPSQDDNDDDEAGEESEIDEGHDENDGTEEDEDGSPGEDGETQSDDHAHTPTTEVVKKIAMKSNKKSSSALPPAGDSVMKNPRQNIKNNNNSNNNSSNSINHQNQPGQNKRKKEITGNASAAGTKKKKRSNRGRGRPGRGRGK